MLRKSLAFVVVALLLAAGASAQSVGLVLSGGGAKGLYHIGVIQALEENEIPIDYVAGTSMGSIIAALYAAGYSPEEMRAIVDSGQVREWVSGRIDSRYASYYRQMQDQPSMLTLRLNLRDEEKRSDAKNKSRLVLPSHLISSSQIDLALAELLTPASTASGGDFDRLMVPFRCVASDLVARKPYVLKTGDLGEAVRASMAIPLAFNPIEKDSMLLYDGGIYDNFPWKPLDETFRPDYLIGSKFSIDWTTIICDYFLAFTALGFGAGLFARRRWSVFYGTVIGGLLRFLAHYLVGALVWGKYMPDEFFGMSMTSPWFYSLLYNGSYMLPDIILCAVVFALLYRPLKKYFTGADLIAA